MTNKEIKEYVTLAEMGFDSLIPPEFVNRFTKRDDFGNHKMPVQYKDHINAHGFGSQFIDELRQKKGYMFGKLI